MRVVLACIALAACGFPKPKDVGGGSDASVIDAPADAAIDAPPDAPGVCNVLTQTGCSGNQRCTYVNNGSGFGVACEPMGTAQAGASCTVDMQTQLDNCVGGTVCAGTCKQVCNTQGSNSCPGGYVCVGYSRGTNVIGACDQECSPLDDNDFDGPGGMHQKTGTVCPQQMQGCYGAPSQGPAPTVFTCANDVNYAQNVLHHRAYCTAASGCADPNGNPYLNGCNQGYLPLLTDMTGSSAVVCVALCKPANCDITNCGGGANAIGVLPHRCNTIDAVGNFNTSNNGDQCAYWWMFEVDPTGTKIIHSPYSDSIGICIDHSKYKYDSNGNGMLDANDAIWPPCQQLQPGMGTTTQPGAAMFGCEDSTHSGLPSRAPNTTSITMPMRDMRILGSP